MKNLSLSILALVFAVSSFSQATWVSFIEMQRSLQRIAETTAQFFNPASVTIRIAKGDEWIKSVRVGSSAYLTGSQPASQLATRGANLPATVYQDNRQIHIPDLDNIDASMADWPAKADRP